MKVKICPWCGRQNVVSAWNCQDCGETLSVKTLVDLDLGMDKIPPILVSPYFKQEVLRLKGSLALGESIMFGFNITHVARQRHPPFKFGFVIFTSERLIKVLYDSDYYLFTERDYEGDEDKYYVPCRPYQVMGDEYMAVISSPNLLSKDEIASREVVFIPFNEIAHCSYGILEHESILFYVELKLENDNKETLNFYHKKQAKRAYEIICQR